MSKITQIPDNVNSISAILCVFCVLAVFGGFQKLGVNFASRRFKQMVRVEVSLGKEGREDRTRNHHRNQHRRFMVRGYWPGPASEWKGRRMRWIEPYWKGPDIAGVIKRGYRLKP